MPNVTVRIPTPLRSFANGADQVQVHGGTVGEVVRSLGEVHDGLIERILDSDGGVRQFVNLYLGSDNIRDLQGLDTPVSERDIVSILPAVAGGCA
jgi:molybdopterin converting factor small subunit